MSHTLTVEEAASRLAELVSTLHQGEEITLLSNNQPVARIIPVLPTDIKRRHPGTGKGKLTILKEDEEHLDDFREYME